MGYSDGGQIALELGIRYPGLARALVLGGTQFRFSEAYLEAARALLGIAEDGGDRKALNLVYSKTFGTGVLYLIYQPDRNEPS